MVGMEYLVAGSVTSPAGVGKVRVGVASVVGRGRDVNQDSVLAGPEWFVVADGVGGHGAGDVASRMAVDLLASRATPDGRDELHRVIDDVNSTILECARRGQASHMATTVVGAVLIGDDLHVFHLGDSRCYAMLDGVIELVTRDHSYVQELVDAGVLSSDRARSHPRRNLITRALGVESVAQADVGTIGAADRVLLCSDGVSSVLTSDQIELVLSTWADPRAAAEALVEAAVAAGTRDDATALVIDGLVVR